MFNIYTLAAFLGLGGGIALALVLKQIHEVPFPFEYRRTKPHSTVEDKAIVECCKDIGDGDQLDIVTGSLNANIFEMQHVKNAVDGFLERGGSIKILTGPLDPKTKSFRDYFENGHVQVFQVDRRPQIHFRIGSKKVSEEIREPFRVCEELPHTKNHDNGYRIINSIKIARGYEAWFEALIRDSRKCKSQEDLVILGEQ